MTEQYGFAGPDPFQTGVPAYYQALALVGNQGGNSLDKMLTAASFEWAQMRPYWRRVADVRGGTIHLRAVADETLGGNAQARGYGYLPKMSNEDDATYRARLQTAILLDFVVRGVEGYSSKPFAEEPEIKVPSYIDYILSDADGQGTPIAQFAKELFQELFYNAIVHVLVVGVERDGAERPALKIIHGPEMFDALLDPATGLDYVRHAETVKDASAMMGRVRSSSLKSYIWSIDRMGGLCYERQRSMVGRMRWALKDQFAFPDSLQGEIPLATAYSIRRGPMLATSSFWPVVDLSLQHFRELSEHGVLKRRGRFPVTAIMDAKLKPASQQKDSATKVSSIRNNAILELESENDRFPARIETAEIDPMLITASREEIDDLIEQMSVRTVSVLLKSNTGDETATAKAIDTAEETSELSSAVTNVEAMLTKALFFAARWVQPSAMEQEIEVVFDRSFGFQTAQEAREEVDDMMGQARDQAGEVAEEVP